MEQYTTNIPRRFRCWIAVADWHYREYYRAMKDKQDRTRATFHWSRTVRASKHAMKYGDFAIKLQPQGAHNETRN
jgi:hypothetical protein